MGVQGFLQQGAVGALGEHLHRRRNNGGQLGSHQVAAGLGNGPVELHILLQVVLAVEDVVLHLIVQLLHLGDLLRGGVVGCQSGNGRLDDIAYFQQVKGQPLFVLDKIQPQGVISQAWLIRHKGACPVAHRQDVLGFQPLDSLTHGTAGHSHFLGQSRFCRELITSLQFFFQDVILDLLGHLFC